MTIEIRTYTSLTFIILTSLLYGQSKNCYSVYSKGAPTVKCVIYPLKFIQDTTISFIPKNCNDIRFDSTANGHWKIFSSDSSTLLQIVDFKNAKRHGPNIYYYPNRQVRAKLNYTHDHLTGEEILYSETGKVIEKGFYDAKQSFNGIVTQYWDNGNIASEQIMKNGWYSGKEKYWDKEGTIITEEAFTKLWYDCN